MLTFTKSMRTQVQREIGRAAQSHHYAPTSVSRWLQIYNTILLNITMVRY